MSLSASLEAAVRTGEPQRMPWQRYDLEEPEGRWEARYWDALNTPVLAPDGLVRYILHETEDVTARVRGEAALARAERQAERILDRIADAYIVLDRDFRFVDVNPAAERSMQRTRVELPGRSHWELFPASHDIDAGRNYRRAAREGIDLHFTQHYRYEGYDVHLEMDAYPTDEGGVAVFWRDVTERVRADAALRASEARFRLMADAVPQIVWVTDAEGQTEFFNRQWTDYTGAPYEPTTAQAVAATAVHPDDAAVTLERFDDARRRGGTFLVEHRIRSAAGDYRWFLVRAEPYRDPATGEIVRWFGASVDIHDRREAEALVRAIGARQTFLLALADRLLPLADPEQIQFEAARALGQHLGASPVGYAEIEADGEHSVVVVRNYTDGVVGIEGRYRVADYSPALIRALRAGRTVARADVAGDPTLSDAERAAHVPLELGATVDLPLVRDGRLVAVLFAHHRAPHAWAVDELTLLADVAARTWDAVERARAEAALEATNAQLEDRQLELELANRLLQDNAVELELQAEADAARERAEAASRAKSEFLAVMSHELRTPLSAIGGYAELIELGIRGPVTDQQREDLARIQRSQRSLLGLINEVLNYARLETGTVTYDLADVPVAEAVGAAEVLVAPQLRAKGLGYAWAGGDPAVAVRADRDKLQQVLLNLLSNAIKFTNARAGLPGRVEVSCEAAADGAGGAGPGQVLIRVRDTGVGIPAEKLGAIFEPFVQVDTKLTREHEGTGLGLASSRDLARGMGGELTVESTPGGGSTFTLALPRA